MPASVWLSAATAVLTAIALCGQDLRFEVASVKPSAGSDGPTMRIDPGGRFTAIGITLRNLVTLAYGIRDEDLAGAPSWINSARFDIVAKPQGEVKEATAIGRGSSRWCDCRLFCRTDSNYGSTASRRSSVCWF